MKGRSVSFQKHYSIPPRCQAPFYYFLVFAFFSLLPVFSARFAPMEQGGESFVYSPLSLASLDSSPARGRAKTQPLGSCLPRVRGRCRRRRRRGPGAPDCSPLSLAALAGVSPAPLALSRFLRRALVSACKNRSAAPLTAPCFVRWTRSLFVPPEGEPSSRPWAEENFVVRRTFFSFALPQTLQRLTQVRLPPPAGEVAQRFAL